MECVIILLFMFFFVFFDYSFAAKKKKMSCNIIHWFVPKRIKTTRREKIWQEGDFCVRFHFTKKVVVKKDNIL